MSRIDKAIDRIKILECPTGELENRVTGILEEYGVANKNQVSIARVKLLDNDEAQAYKMKIPGEKHSFIIMASSGYDDYVAKVVDIRSRS